MTCSRENAVYDVDKSRSGRFGRSTDNKLPIETICSESPATMPFAFEKARQASHGSSIHPYRRDTAR